MSRSSLSTRGRIIAFSGLDGAGKSTQIEMLTAALRQLGRRVVYLWSRGGYTPLFHWLKSLVRRGSGGKALPKAGDEAARRKAFRRGWVRRVWLWLAIWELMWIYGVRIRLHRFLRRVVICDRYLWDTLVDFRLDFPEESIERWWSWRLLTRLAARPDAEFLLLIPPEESVRRSDIKGEPFRFSHEVLAQRLAEYESLIPRGRWTVLDGRRSKDDLSAEIRKVLAELPGGALLPPPESVAVAPPP